MDGIRGEITTGELFTNRCRRSRPLTVQNQTLCTMNAMIGSRGDLSYPISSFAEESARSLVIHSGVHKTEPLPYVVAMALLF